jgi:ribulose-5-phosphate 4-epimerase/fuculose-1-phosphate aldolase
MTDLSHARPAGERLAPGGELSTLKRHAPLRKFWFDDVPPREGVAEERRYRQERLAVAFRLFARYGFDQGLAGHITARDPEWPDHFWVNPFGKHFSRIRVSDLLLVNAQGEIVVGEGPVNQAAFAIHAAIHEARPEVVAAAHTHSLYGKAWSTLGRKLDPLTQDSCAFYQDHALFDDFRGVVLDTDEGAHRCGAGREQGGDFEEPRHPDGRSERRGGGLVVHRARQRLSRAIARRSGRRAPSDSP